MKNITHIIVLLLALSCKAQSPIINNLDWDGIDIPNSYLKDTNNDLNNFEGTYVHTSADTIFTIKLRKIEMEFTGVYFEDMLIGEFEYKIGNNTLFNTLSNFNTNYQDQSLHYLKGWRILKNTSLPPCSNCAPNEKRVSIGIFDSKLASSFILKRTTVSGNQALQVYKFTQGPISREAGDPPKVAIVRDGDFLFIKQP